MTTTTDWVGTYTTRDDGWEIRTLPYRNPRTGITSDSEVSITAIHRSNGWVLRLERATPERAASFEPNAHWFDGCDR